MTSTKISHHSLRLQTQECLEFIDLTERIQELVRGSGIRNGLVNIQTRHTTTAILINENEPLLLQDMKRTLERIVPQGVCYQHNDFTKRTVNLGPAEDKNGHSHCKAIFLHTSETLNLHEGNIELGSWQRIFFVELDRARERAVSVMILGSD